ncbi:hypothetical protein AALA13_18150 [Lachnospiraceae bacterium 50-23]
MGDKNYYCKIDGTVYNLKKIQDIIDKNPDNPGGAETYLTLRKEYQIPGLIADILCTIIKETGEIPTDYNEALEEIRARNRKKYGIVNPAKPGEYMSPFPPRLQCPRCGNINIAHYSRNVYNYKCRRCKHTWSQCPKCGGTEITCYMSYEPNGGYSLYYKTCSKCKHRWIE